MTPRQQLQDLEARTKKIEKRLALARADRAALDSETFDPDDEGALAKLAKRRREAADVEAALEGQLRSLAAQVGAAEEVAAAAEIEAAVQQAETLRAQVEKEDQAIGAAIKAVLQQARSKAATLDVLVRQAETARAALPPERRGRTVRAQFDTAAIVALASQVTL